MMSHATEIESVFGIALSFMKTCSFLLLFVAFLFTAFQSVKLQDDVWTKKKISTFSYKLVQISPIMILVNSGAFLSISRWFCELTELIFVMILYISSTGYPPPPKKNAKDYGYVQVANR